MKLERWGGRRSDRIGVWLGLLRARWEVSMPLGTLRRRTASRRSVWRFFRSVYQRSVLRPLLYVAALVHLRRGHLLQAESCLCRAALIAPRSFSTRVQLGRVYFLMEEFFKAEQQFLKAQEIDPKRFHRDHLPEDYGGWEELEPRDRATEALFGEYDAEGSLYSFEESETEAEPSGGFRFGDFSSYEEWERFRALPPITAAEIRDTDWDRILSDPAF
jgi:tetratricopeptide (TPR) repeat protein